jgi:hypothetical protein
MKTNEEGRDQVVFFRIFYAQCSNHEAVNKKKMKKWGKTYLRRLSIYI